jgi:pimeloyl-ACP methyl ester carboxylesterase
MGLTARVEHWREKGSFELVGGNRIHVHQREGEGIPLVLLHGFPSSSYDFRELWPLLGERPLLTLDFLGFGLSDKPRGHGYGLAGQADLVEEIAARRFPGREVFLIAHDMGTSVATELMAREMDASAKLRFPGALLFNGSIVLDRASLTPSQRILRSRLGPLAARLSSKRVFRQQFGGVFSAAHPLSDEEAEDQWALICHNGGRTMGHELVAYLGERVRLAGRWHGAVSDWRGELSLAWGLLDSVATTEVLDALKQLRPGLPVEELPGLGHYPQLEDPVAMAGVVEAALARLG